MRLVDEEEEEEGDWEGDQEGVDAVEEAAVARNPIAGILESVFAFELGFNKVADGAEDTC